MGTSGPKDKRSLITLRSLVLAAITLNVAMVMSQTLLYRPLLAQPGAAWYVAEPLILLVAYAVIVVAVTNSATTTRRQTLWQATALGAFVGVTEIINLTLETFGSVSNVYSTGPFILGAFALWGVAGAWRAWQTGAFLSGLLAAVWSAMITMLITVTYGFSLNYTSIARLMFLESHDPDFLASHWTDLHAFALANQFDAGFSHLLGALLIGLLVGALGSGVGLLIRRSGAPLRAADARHGA